MDLFVILLCFTGVFVHGLLAAENIPSFESIAFGLEPSFDVPVINVTVQEGDVGVLPCSVDYLGEHKVVWTDQWSTLLTLDDRRIIDDPRISIERPYTKDWNLHIRKTSYADRGQYTCQINTNPVKTKTVMLIVLVPSKIINELSSGDKTVREGETVTLVCNVTGVPTPDVTWYKLPNEGSQKKERLDLDPGSYTLIRSCAYTLHQTEYLFEDNREGRNMFVNVIGYISTEMDGIGTTGEVLIIHNVSRYCDGTYECVAYNNVEPAVTRQIKVFVEFAPEVSLPTKRLGQFLGRETILDCEITAYPHAIMNWRKGEEDIDFFNKEKYQVELYSGNDESTRKTLSLRVRDIHEEDYGEYTCYAENKIGSDKETMLLYDYATHEMKKTTPSKRPPLIDPPVSKPNIPLHSDGRGTGKTFITIDGSRKPILHDTNRNDAHRRLRPGNDDSVYENEVAKRTGSRAVKCSGTFVTICEGEGTASMSHASESSGHVTLNSVLCALSLITSNLVLLMLL
ncbi:limbic system-associated membrane protein-like isoform X1 [Ruditapes philippinarum]|uniref:limbic system-associated membrane protein-like isoform X1 n=1 Tax=Ruditapes philippinarum TaxID=129788 RepID=UPI00295A5911|nr:limbic system-associated membrane protein-like isoform X1 [Ruditapes philippinarum]XP_060592718.1 limbic system-associated membrane protein-like isoform X1 [Ruditapes philippinarum]XP_060592720.1 limbic system-associated membrane protein-like isoform X1 [Ruditapes philippinarum]